MSDKATLWNFLYRPRDGDAPATFGSRVRHFLFCVAMAAALTVFLLIGSWLAPTMFRVILSMWIVALSQLVGPEAQIGPWIWMPVAGILGMVWLAIVLIPAAWATLNLSASVLGALSAVHPRLSDKPAVIGTADALVHLAYRVMRPFGSSR